MRIILADHHPEPLWALRELLHEQPGYTLVGEALDAQNLLIQVKSNITDLVIMDCDLPGMRVEELVSRLHAFDPRPVVIIMSSGVDQHCSQDLSEADDYISKNENAGCLLDKLYQYSLTKKEK